MNKDYKFNKGEHVWCVSVHGVSIRCTIFSCYFRDKNNNPLGHNRYKVMSILDSTGEIVSIDVCEEELSHEPWEENYKDNWVKFKVDKSSANDLIYYLIDELGTDVMSLI